MRLLIAFLIVFALSNSADAQSRSFLLSADMDGTTVTARHLKADREWIDTENCVAPCEMRLKLKRLGPLLFEHPDHGVRRVAIPRSAWSEKGPVTIRAAFERAADPEEDRFQTLLDAAKKGPDRKAKTFRKIAPNFEPRAVRSGWCVILYRIDTSGYPRDMRMRDCSENMFSENALLAVEEARFIPRIENGEAVETTNKKSLVRFRLAGPDGKVLPPRIDYPKR